MHLISLANTILTHYLSDGGHYAYLCISWFFNPHHSIVLCLTYEGCLIFKTRCRPYFLLLVMLAPFSLDCNSFLDVICLSEDQKKQGALS